MIAQQKFYDASHANHFVKASEIASGEPRHRQQRLDELFEMSQRGQSSSISVDLTATLDSTDVAMTDSTPAPQRDVVMESSSPIGPSSDIQASQDQMSQISNTGGSVNVPHIQGVLDATGMELERGAKLEDDVAATNNWDKLAFTEKTVESLDCPDDLKITYIGKLKQMSTNREKDSIETLMDISFPKGSAVNMDKTVAHLIQLKLQAKALQATLGDRCYTAIDSRMAASQSSTAASDIQDAQRQCQDALLSLVLSEEPKKEPVDQEDV